MIDPGDLSDGEIIGASLADPSLFEHIFRRHYRAVYRYGVRAAGRDDGADIAAEVFVRAFAGRHRFDVRYASARPWLLGIAAHLVADLYRRLEREGRALGRLVGRPGERVEFEQAAADRLDAHASVEAIRNLLAGLRPEERDVVGLFALADLSYQQIAEALQIPVGSVKSRLSRARSHIRNLLGAIDEPIPDDSHG